MVVDQLYAILGGLGFGSLATTVIGHFISRRAAVADISYSEKREAYIGLLSALHRAAISPSNENSKDFALWVIRCQLFGSNEVARFAQAMVDTNEGQVAARNDAFVGLVEAMKSDLRR